MPWKNVSLVMNIICYKDFTGSELGREMEEIAMAAVTVEEARPSTGSPAQRDGTGLWDAAAGRV